MLEYQVQIVPKPVTPRSQYESFHKDFIAIAKDSNFTFSSSFDATGEITETGLFYFFESKFDARMFKTKVTHAFPLTINELSVTEIETANYRVSSRRIVL